MIELHSRQDKGFLIHGTDRVMNFPAGEQHLVVEAPDNEHPFLAVIRGTDAEDLIQAGMWVDSVHQRGDKASLAIPYRAQSFADVRAVLRKELEAQR